MWSFFRRKPNTEPPLLKLNGRDAITMHQAYEGFLGIGGIGSGKTSTLAHLMLALMRRGCGFLILTAKPDDYEGVLRLAATAGRLNDVRRFRPR